MLPIDLRETILVLSQYVRKVVASEGVLVVSPGDPHASAPLLMPSAPKSSATSATCTLVGRFAKSTESQAAESRHVLDVVLNWLIR